MENPDLRISVGMKPDQKGVRIRRVEPTAPESQVLKPSDVILSFDGVKIANDGTGNSFFLSFLLSYSSIIQSIGLYFQMSKSNWKKTGTYILFCSSCSFSSEN